MTLAAVTLRATPARVYLVLELLSSVNPGAAVDRRAVYRYCDASGYLDGRHAKRMKFRDALDRLVDLGLVDRLSDDRLAISRGAPRPQLPEFALEAACDPSQEPVTAKTFNEAAFTDGLFQLREAGLIEAVPATDSADEMRWRRTAKGIAYGQESQTAGLSAAERSDLVMEIITTVGGPDNAPVDLDDVLHGIFPSLGDWTPIVQTLLEQGQLFSFVRQLPTCGVYHEVVVRADGPQDPSWRHYESVKGRVLVMPQGSAPPPGSSLRPIDPPTPLFGGGTTSMKGQELQK